MTLLRPQVSVHGIGKVTGRRSLSGVMRSSMLCAIVAVARKLAGILHRMWIDGSDFKVGFGAKATQRLKLKPAQ